PAAVAYDAIGAAESRGRDVVVVDTAGRLHTQTNLMEELAKVRRVIGQRLEGAPHETLLVIDAATGQNGLQQARLFSQAVEVTGNALTKPAGAAKGGVAIAIAHELGLPVKLIGIGESLEDLRPFDPDDFARAILEPGPKTASGSSPGPTSRRPIPWRGLRPSRRSPTAASTTRPGARTSRPSASWRAARHSSSA